MAKSTEDVGAALTRADGVLLPREKRLQGRDYCSLFGMFAVARTCDHTPGEPGIYPLDAQVYLAERCDSSCLQEWMTVFEVGHSSRDSAGLFAQHFDRDVAERVLMDIKTDVECARLVHGRPPSSCRSRVGMRWL